MDLVYSVTHSDGSCARSPFHSGSSTTTSAWSQKNLLAYSREKVVRGYVEHDINIVDPNQPWNVHVIPAKTAPVKHLKWNQSGKKLLCITSSGFCTVWAASNNLTNVWKEKTVFAFDLREEEVLAASWLSDGRKAVLNLDRTKEPMEKVTRTSDRPVLAQIGGQPMEGYLIVTASGLIAVKCLTQSDQPIFAKTRLKIPGQLRVSDVAFTNQGDVVVMASSGYTEDPVNFWTVTLTYNDETSRLSFDVDKMPSIVLRCETDKPGTYPCISHAHFMSPVNPEYVLICVANSTASVIESWLYKDHKEPPPTLHKAFIPQSGLATRIFRWKCVPVSSPPLPEVLRVLLPQVNVGMSAIKASQDMKLMNILGIALLLPNNVIKILHRITLAELLTFQVPDDVTEENVSRYFAVGQKRSQSKGTSSLIGHIQLSPMSCAMAAFDEHSNLMMYKVAPWLQNRTSLDLNMAVKHLMHLLYYCVYVGQEWWDVLLHMQSSIATSVCDSLVQEFMSQPRALQQMLRSRLLAVRISIYQRSSRNADATDCHLRLMFETIAVVFRSLLRLPQNLQEDQEPADKLHEACSAPFETDISKLLQSIETDQRTLQSLQQLIQWVADVALYLLAVVPQAGLPDVPGSSLVLDKEFLATLRELLVILQMWRLLKSACAPVFCVLDDRVDALPLVFKLLTDVLSALTAVDFQGRIPENVVDECSLLTNQIVIPAIDIIQPVNGVLQRMNSDFQSFRFQFGKRPSKPQLSGNFAANARFLRVDDVAKVDNLRRIYLGISPTVPLKICSRCGIMSMLNSKQESVIEFWDQRFAVTCLCGGSWQGADPVLKK